MMGPLHGVPMTLKDQFDVEGYDSTLGYVGRAFKPAVQDCVLVSLLKQMGAVIVAKSNLPQSIMVRHAPRSSSWSLKVVWVSDVASGVKPRILYGDLPYTLRIPTSLPVVPPVEKARFYLFTEPLWAGARTLVGAFGYHLT
jgi:hypothetical protein